MKTHLLATAALALSVLVAVPASAQVSGIAIADPAIALASSQARQTADAQIATTFQAQRTQLEQRITQGFGMRVIGFYSERNPGHIKK